jgi:hypothetical protein
MLSEASVSWADLQLNVGATNDGELQKVLRTVAQFEPFGVWFGDAGDGSRCDEFLLGNALAGPEGSPKLTNPLRECRLMVNNRRKPI